MPRPMTALSDLAVSLRCIAESLSKLTTASNDVAREQRVTNLIVRSQISADPAEKEQLLTEARQRMDVPRRRSPHDRI